MAVPHSDAVGVPTECAAVMLFEHGGPDVLRYGVYPRPEAGPYDAVVDVYAIGVTGFDLKYRRGLLTHHQLPGRKLFPLPQQLGREAAGVVQWVGSSVTTLSPGDHVVAVTHPEDPYGVETARGLGNLSRDIEIPGHQSLGSYARYLVRDERLWLRLPPQVDLEQAALTLWPFSTVHRVLTDRLHVRLSDIVVILGSTGGMGIAAIQLAKLLGARPVAATRDLSKAPQLKALGAVEVIDVRNLDAGLATLRALTGGRGPDHVIDFAGDLQVLSAIASAIRVGGSVCIGAGDKSAERVPIRVADMIRFEMNLLGIRGARRGDMLAALELLEQQRITIPVARRFPLANAVEAHEAMERGLDVVGRVLLIPER
jgi:NADPH:quinone reductase-like Zn-dependent oxidoreductase